MGEKISRLTTILEAPSPPPMQASHHNMTSFTYVPELHHPPPPPPPPPQVSSLKYTVTPPVYSRILRRAEQVWFLFNWLWFGLHHSFSSKHSYIKFKQYTLFNIMFKMRRHRLNSRNLCFAGILAWFKLNKIYIFICNL